MNTTTNFNRRPPNLIDDLVPVYVGCGDYIESGNNPSTAVSQHQTYKKRKQFGKLSQNQGLMKIKKEKFSFDATNKLLIRVKQEKSKTAGPRPVGKLPELLGN